MRGVRGVEVTEEGVGSTALEIFDTGAKIPEEQTPQLRHVVNTETPEEGLVILNKYPLKTPLYLPHLSAALTQLGGADEVADAAHATIVLSLRLVQLHADPLTAGELRRPAEPQCASLRDRDTREEGSHERCLQRPTHRQAEVQFQHHPDSLMSDLQVVQDHTLSQPQPQRGQHQVSGDVVVVWQRGSGEVTAQGDGVQQQLLQLFGHQSRLRLVQAHVHRIRNHLSGNLTLIVLQKPVRV